MLPTPKRFNKTKSHERAARQEKRTAKRLGGETVKGSGSGDVKGDVRLKGIVRIEAKHTKHKSFRVTEEIIDGIELAVAGTGEIPVIEVEICQGKRRCFIIPDWALEMIVGEIKRAQG